MQSADSSNAFLLALYSVTGGDTAVKTSMHEVGATIGLDKAESGKTAEVQLLSPRAKTAVVREVLRALQANLIKSGTRETAERIGRVIGK